MAGAHRDRLVLASNAPWLEIAISYHGCTVKSLSNDLPMVNIIAIELWGWDLMGTTRYFLHVFNLSKTLQGVHGGLAGEATLI